MKRPKTLRVRFAFWVTGLLLAAFMVFGAFVYFSLAQGLTASIDDSLRLSASQAIGAANIENGQITFSDGLPEDASATSLLSERGLTIRIFDVSGQVIQAFGPLRALPGVSGALTAANQQPTFATVIEPAGYDRIRTYTEPIIEGNQTVGIVQVAQSLDSVQETLSRLLAALFIAGPLLLIVAAVGGYFLAARALAPIDQITYTARCISANDLSARLNLSVTDDEVGRLATTFDAMIARLDESFKRERQFTADASHELRTPLAAMQAILSVIRAEPRTTEDYEQALADIFEETDRLRSLVEDLLQLARGDTQQVALREMVDLSTLLPNIVDSLHPLAEAKGLTLTCHTSAGLTLHGDSDSLIRLFVNLLDNAVKHTERGAITVDARSLPGVIQVDISDMGSGIPAEQLPFIFNRFYRADVSRAAQGAGLGLAIALEIARAHGGTIEARSVLGTGSTFTVHFPQIE